jgi:hypothetical protein
MTMQSRLQKITQNLSPLQRAILVLQAMREGREPDPELRRIDDEIQRLAFNRYIALLWIANHQIGAVASITNHRVELAEQAVQYWDLFNQAAGLIEEHEGLKSSKPSRNWRTKAVITAPEFLRGLALERRDEAVETIELLWMETLALDAVWADLSQEFGGEDILLPDCRDRHEESRERLTALARKVGLRRLPAEPSEEVTRAYRAAVEDSFQQLGYTGGHS